MIGSVVYRSKLTTEVTDRTALWPGCLCSVTAIFPSELDRVFCEPPRCTAAGILNMINDAANKRYLPLPVNISLGPQWADECGRLGWLCRAEKS